MIVFFLFNDGTSILKEYNPASNKKRIKLKDLTATNKPNAQILLF